MKFYDTPLECGIPWQGSNIEVRRLDIKCNGTQVPRLSSPFLLREKPEQTNNLPKFQSSWPGGCKANEKRRFNKRSFVNCLKIIFVFGLKDSTCTISTIQIDPVIPRDLPGLRATTPRECTSRVLVTR